MSPLYHLVKKADRGKALQEVNYPRAPENQTPPRFLIEEAFDSYQGEGIIA
jgi:hypothetical protein